MVTLMSLVFRSPQADGTQWTRLVRIFYWTLVNPDEFLYKSETPRVIMHM